MTLPDQESTDDLLDDEDGGVMGLDVGHFLQNLTDQRHLVLKSGILSEREREHLYPDSCRFNHMLYGS